MHRYTLKENLISAAIGIAIGLPLSIYAVNHRAPSNGGLLPAPEPVIIENVDPADYHSVVDEPQLTNLVYTETEDVEEMTAQEKYMEEVRLLAALVHAEAGNQDEIGKRLVVDVVLNRVDYGPEFEDSIEGVIYEKTGKTWQFTTAGNGMLQDALNGEATTADYEAVMKELDAEERLDDRILYFTAGSYNPYCTLAYIHGDHYFGY